MEVDFLFKVGLQLDFGKYLILESKDRSHYEFFHRPFIDLSGLHGGAL
jgi:hypothetical protein